MVKISILPYQEAIEAVIKAGGECIVAHPYWNGFTSAEIMQVKNLIALEVYNTDTRYIGKGYSSFGRCGNMSGFKATTPEERDDTKEITSYETEIPADAGLTYLRCQIKDKEGRYAWSSPIKI
ncbi:MAG: hypothetical protein KAS17_08860 [Victivallaceae bacterium]|nr:hypothetical protein [Victivallaceae bacterium]